MCLTTMLRALGRWIALWEWINSAGDVTHHYTSDTKVTYFVSAVMRITTRTLVGDDG
jgi:hypothetical protein